jgi:SpoVK/Ycf46/Vps4 family AAA+-type ATPase
MSKKINKINRGYDHYGEFSGSFIPRTKYKSVDKINPGIYTMGQLMDGSIIFSPMGSLTDELITLPNFVSQQIIEEIRGFWSKQSRENFDRYKLVYKRGILLYGKPGTGKTCTIASVMEEVVRDGGIVIFNPRAKLLSAGIEMVREIEPNIKCLVVFEEFDSMVNDAEFLSLLDGEMQLDNIVYVATTNFIEKIPSRVKNRPSRFATVIEVGAPDAETRYAYLKAKLGGEIDVTEWTEKTNGLVLDQIKDVIVSVFCIGLKLDDALDKIRKMGELSKNDINNPIDKMKGIASSLKKRLG